MPNQATVEARAGIADLRDRIARRFGDAPAPNERMDTDTVVLVNTLIDYGDWLIEHLQVYSDVSAETSDLVDLLRPLQQAYWALLLGGSAEYQQSTARAILPEGTDAAQAWFWTAEWQAKECQVDEAIQNGEFIRYESEEAFEAALAAIDATLDVRANV